MWYPFILTVKAWVLFYAGTWVFARLVNKDDGEWVQGKPLGIVMGYYALGMFGHTYWLAYAVMIGTLPLLAASRGEAAALFFVAAGAIVDLTNPLIVGGTWLIFIDKWVCLSVGLSLAMILKPRVGPRPAARFDLPMIIMLALELVQARGLNLTSTSRVALSTLLSEGLPYLTIVLSLGRLRDMRRVMLALIYIGFILSLVAVYEAASKTFVYLPMGTQLGSGTLEYYRLAKMRGGILRAPTSFSDATAFAQFLVIVMMATLSYRPYFRSTRKLGVALGLISIGIFVTSTRNAWIGLLIGILAFDLYRRRYLSMVGKAAALGVLYGTVQLLAEFIPYFAAITGGAADSAGTADYRTRLLTRGIEEFRKHPLAGTDYASLMVNLQDMKQGEGIIDFVNGYLFYALNAGIGGLIGLVLVFLLPAFVMLNIRRAMTRRQIFLERTAAFVFSIAVSFFIMTAFTGFGGRNSIHFYLALCVGSVLFSWRRILPDRLDAWEPTRTARQTLPASEMAPAEAG